MATIAQALEIGTIPEQQYIALMRADMVDLMARGDAIRLDALDTAGLLSEYLRTQGQPARRGVEQANVSIVPGLHAAMNVTVARGYQGGTAGGTTGPKGHATCGEG